MYDCELFMSHDMRRLMSPSALGLDHQLIQATHLFKPMLSCEDLLRGIAILSA